jgi:HAD superfamily hydrolase (TIGR01549 family)
VGPCDLSHNAAVSGGTAADGEATVREFAHPACYDARDPQQRSEGGSIVLSGVLFDLDGTLLDIDLNSFFREYFAALGPVVAEALGGTGHAQRGLDAVLEGTRAMSLPHAGSTNQEAFNARFNELTGANLDLDEYAQAFERFYADVFPSLQGNMKGHEGAREIVVRALELGLKVAIATNPIFPRSAIEERMRWANVADLPVHVVTTYENMHSAKPNPAYFLETAELLGVRPTDALMVGDDRVLDMSAADVGMKTFYVGPGVAPGTDFAGSLVGLADLLPRLAV